MVTKETLDRINELAAKNKKEGLTKDEIEERAILREEYLESIRGSVRGHLSRIKYVEDLTEEERENILNKNK